MKPIGAEELLQHFILKSAAENSSSSSVAADVHDQKSTICLDEYIHWFNRLTSFVATETLKHTQRRLRVRMLNYFIETAEHCRQLNNFNSMSAIIGKTTFVKADLQGEFIISRRDARDSVPEEGGETQLAALIELHL